MATRQTEKDIARLKKDAILVAENLWYYKLIARSVGRDEETLINWRKSDPDFSNKLEIARTKFIDKQMGKAKPDFLLERTERELFAPPAQQVKLEGNIVEQILEGYGLKGEEKDAGETPESSEGTSSEVA